MKLSGFKGAQGRRKNVIEGGGRPASEDEMLRAAIWRVLYLHEVRRLGKTLEGKPERERKQH